MKPEFIRFGIASSSAAEQSAAPHTLFFGPGVNRPSRTEHLWILTQLARWSEIPFPRNYVEILERICAVAVYSTAARELGLEDVSYQRSGIDLFDGIAFNTDDPIAYLNRLSIHKDFSVAEIPVGVPRALVA